MKKFIVALLLLLAPNVSYADSIINWGMQSTGTSRNVYLNQSGTNVNVGQVNTSNNHFTPYYAGSLPPETGAGSFVLNSGPLGTPSTGNASNLTGYLVSALSGLGTNVATALTNTLDASGGIASVTASNSKYAPIFLDSVSALASYSVPAAVNALYLSGYSAFGDNGAGIYIRVSTPSPVRAWHHQSADGAWWQLTTLTANPYQFGAKGDGSTDDSAAAQNAISYAQTFSHSLYFPKANYVFGKLLTISVPVDIKSDQSASMRWTNTTATSLATVSSITVSGTTATITFASAHNLISGQAIALSGFTSANFNGTFPLLTVPTTTTATFTIASGTPNATVIGTASIPTGGFLIDYRGTVNGGTGGVNKISLPGLYSPGVSSGLNYPGYGTTGWSASSRSGNGITVWGGSRYTIEVQTMLGWSNGIYFASTYDTTFGAQAPENVDVFLNTSDLCGAAILFDSGPANAGQLAAVNVTANTVFAKYPVAYLTTNGSTTAIIDTRVTITGQAFTNESGGACLYAVGVYINSSVIDENWCYAGYQATTAGSPTGTSTTLVLPYIWGDQASHGLTTDGNSPGAYFGGKYNDITIGSAAASVSGYGSSYATAGQAIRVKDVGENNKIRIRYLDQPPNVAVALSTTQGEANYNGGVGGAALSKRVYVSAAVPTLAAGATATFWVYHSLLSAGTVRNIAVEPAYTNLSLSGLSYGAGDNTGTNNREIYVTFKNNTASSITGATYTFWVEPTN